MVQKKEKRGRLLKETKNDYVVQTLINYASIQVEKNLA